MDYARASFAVASDELILTPILPNEGVNITAS